MYLHSDSLISNVYKSSRTNKAFSTVNCKTNLLIVTPLLFLYSIKIKLCSAKINTNNALNKVLAKMQIILKQTRIAQLSWRSIPVSTSALMRAGQAELSVLVIGVYERCSSFTVVQTIVLLKERPDNIGGCRVAQETALRRHQRNRLLNFKRDQTRNLSPVLKKYSEIRINKRIDSPAEPIGDVRGILCTESFSTVRGR